MNILSGQINGAQARGAIGALTADRSPRLPGFCNWGNVGANFKLPTANMHISAYNYAYALFKQNASIPIQVTFFGYDNDPWATIGTGAGFWIFEVLVVAMYLVNACLAFYRISGWIWEKKGIDLTVGFGCLALECIVNTIKVIQSIFWGTFNNFSIPNIDLLLTWTWTLTIIIAIWVTFFWLDLTSDPFYHGKFMGIMKYPAIVLCLGVIAAEIAFDSLRTSGKDYLSYLNIFYASILMSIAIINLIAAYRILGPFSKTPETKKKVRKIIYKIVGSATASVLGCIVYFCFLYPPVQWNPANRGSTWFFLYFCFWIQSLLLILIFKVPKSSVSSTGSKVKGTKETKETKDTKDTNDTNTHTTDGGETE